ncbi:hypothetical protein ACFE04_030134 [Oxalis oulophora]
MVTIQVLVLLLLSVRIFAASISLTCRFVKGYRSSLTRNNKITYSVPYALISTRIETLELGQGLSMGVLNLAIVIPQTTSLGVRKGAWTAEEDKLLKGCVEKHGEGKWHQIIVSVGSGPWDQLFGGGNSPAFVVAALSAFASGLLAILAIPRSSAAQKPKLII